MIRINKSTTVPLTLESKGNQALGRLKAAFSAEGQAYTKSVRLGGRQFDFDASIWKAADVVTQLKADQHGKCCYCETVDFELNGDPTSEHWRPKGSARQSKLEDSTYPGYYWLAYDWGNLFWACMKCNREKSDIFPIQHGIQRALGDSMPLEDVSEVLIIHPVLDSPEKHITFERHLVKATTNDEGHVSLKGQNTITFCDLKRLNEPRMKRFQEVQKNIALVGLSKEEIGDSTRRAIASSLGTTDLSEVDAVIAAARSFIASAALDSAPYAGMVRANFPQLPTSRSFS